MKKYENFVKSLDILRSADFDRAEGDEIYRTGIIGQYSLTFELAWKAMQAVLELHGAQTSGSPRECLQLGYQYYFIDDEATWLLMLKKRNTSTHIYNEDEVIETISLIRDKFIKAFEDLAQTLKVKMEE